MKDPFWKSTSVLLHYKKQLAIAFFGSAISAACFGAGLGMIYPTLVLLLQQKIQLSQWLVKYAEDHAGWKHDLIHTVLPYIPADRFQTLCMVMGIIAVLSIVGSIARYFHESITLAVAMRSAMRWRQQIFRRLIRVPFPTMIKSGTSDHISRIVTDTNLLSAGYQAVLGRAAGEIMKGAAGLVVAYVSNPLLTLIALIAAPVIAVVLRKFGKKIRRSTRKQLGQAGRLIAGLKESLGGISVVKVHNAEGFERRRFGRLNRAVLNEALTVRKVKALSGPLIDTMALLAIIGVAIISAWLIFKGEIASEQFMMVFVGLGGAAGSLKPLSNLHNQIHEASAAAQRVFEVLDLPVEPIGREDRRAKPTLQRHSKDVTFENVSFAYDGKQALAVDGVTLHVPFGHTVALVGTNGSGKTTLFNMIPRLIAPTSGRVLVDGVDIANVNLRTLRAQIAVVTQQTIMFEGTIADNIAYGRQHTRLDDVIAAAKAAYADEFVTVQPKGYLTKLGEDGAGLSGGQRQRLCIARAILRNPAILILDEATSQIDADSEAKINEALRGLRHGRTTFIIAHRLSTVIDADLIVVLNAGKIVDQGKHAELLQRCEMYRLLAETQLRTGDRPAGS